MLELWLSIEPPGESGWHEELRKGDSDSIHAQGPLIRSPIHFLFHSLVEWREKILNGQRSFPVSHFLMCMG
jgi:hypothetical protein